MTNSGRRGPRKCPECGAEWKLWKHSVECSRYEGEF